MYVVPIKTIGLEALQATFDAQYPVAEFQGLRSSLEWPVEASAFPMVWVGYSDTDKLSRAGVAHVESSDPATGAVTNPFTRYVFHGSLTYTVVALTSLQCDRIYDELVKVVAFGAQDPLLGRFRTYFDTNDLIEVTIDWDEIEPTGDSAAPGTPWGTDEVVYERSLNLEIARGEFIPDLGANTLVSLSKIVVTPNENLTLDPMAPEFSQWH